MNCIIPSGSKKCHMCAMLIEGRFDIVECVSYVANWFDIGCMVADYLCSINVVVC